MANESRLEYKNPILGPNFELIHSESYFVCLSYQSRKNQSKRCIPWIGIYWLLVYYFWFIWHLSLRWAIKSFSKDSYLEYSWPGIIWTNRIILNSRHYPFLIRKYIIIIFHFEKWFLLKHQSFVVFQFSLSLKLSNHQKNHWKLLTRGQILCHFSHYFSYRKYSYFFIQL